APEEVRGGSGGLRPGPGSEGQTEGGSRRRTPVPPGVGLDPLVHGTVAVEAGKICGVRAGLPRGSESPAGATGKAPGHAQGPPAPGRQLRRTGQRSGGNAEADGGSGEGFPPGTGPSEEANGRIPRIPSVPRGTRQRLQRPRHLAHASGEGCGSGGALSPGPGAQEKGPGPGRPRPPASQATAHKL